MSEPQAPPPATPEPEPSPGPGAPPSRTPGRWSGAGAHLLIAALCALLGFAVVLQVQRTASGDALATARPDDLVQILDELQRREDDLNTEIAGLQDSLARLQRSGQSSEEALAEAQRQAQALGILTGTVPATGPGVSISITDPDRRVTRRCCWTPSRSCATPAPRRSRSVPCGSASIRRSPAPAGPSAWTAPG